MHSETKIVDSCFFLRCLSPLSIEMHIDAVELHAIRDGKVRVAPTVLRLLLSFSSRVFPTAVLPNKHHKCGLSSD